MLTSRLSLSKHLAHNLGNLLLLGKIGVFHNRRNASSRLLLLISKHLILCIYLVFRILTTLFRFEDKLCLIFKLAPSVCRMTFPILASLLVRLVVLLPFQLLRLSLATPSRWTPLALSVFLHCVVALLLTLLRSEERRVGKACRCGL